MAPSEFPSFPALLGGAVCAVAVARFALLPRPVAADPGPISEAAYWRLLEETRDLAAGLIGAPEQEACISLQANAESWAGIREVRLENGIVVPIRTDWLTAALKKCPPDSLLILSRIESLLQARAGAPTPGTVAFNPAQLDEILSQKEFQRDSGDIREDPLQALWKAVQGWFMDLVNRVHVPQGMVLLFGIAATGLLGGILFLALRAFRRNLSPNVDAAPADGRAPGALTSEQAAERAREKSAAGDARLAVRYLYLSALLFLEERGRLIRNRSWTDQEYIRSVAHLPHLAAPLRALVNVFDRVWYGFHAPSEKEYRDYLESVAEIRRHS